MRLATKRFDVGDDADPDILTEFYHCGIGAIVRNLRDQLP